MRSVCYQCVSEPDTGVVTTKVVKGISEHYVLMPNILPTFPTFNPDLDFTLSHDSLGSGNKIFNPRLFIGVQSERLLSRDEFSISFICDPLSPVFDTLLPFSSENEDKVFNPGFLKISERPVAFFNPQSPNFRASANYGILNPDHVYYCVSLFTLGIFCICLFHSYYGLKTKQKRVFSGSSRSRVLIIQDQDKARNILRACHLKEHEITSPTVPSDFIGPAHNPFYEPGQLMGRASLFIF
ncbi:hypothetical protein Tco_0968831 [Tanacetum coccineum]